MTTTSISTEEFDRRFDDGEDMGAFVDWSKGRSAVRRVNVDFPGEIVRRLDREAQRRGVTRQALIKMWIADRLDQAA